MPRPPAPEAAAPVSVLKSGVVEGMAYTLYSDGSIEAQFPQGRCASARSPRCAIISRAAPSVRLRFRMRSTAIVLPARLTGASLHVHGRLPSVNFTRSRCRNSSTSAMYLLRYSWLPRQLQFLLALIPNCICFEVFASNDRRVGADDSREIRPNMADNSGEQQLYPADREHCIRLCQQQYRFERGNSDPDQPSVCRVDAGFGRPSGDAGGAAQAGRSGQALDHCRIHCLPGRRKEVQIAQAPFAHAVRHDAGAISRQMELAARLSDGRAQLRGGPLAARQADGPRPATPRVAGTAVD